MNVIAVAAIVASHLRTLGFTQAAAGVVPIRDIEPAKEFGSLPE